MSNTVGSKKVYRHTKACRRASAKSTRKDCTAREGDSRSAAARRRNDETHLQQLVLLPLDAVAPSLVVGESMPGREEKLVSFSCSARTSESTDLSFWKRVLIRGIPRSQLSSRSSRVRRRFCALASFLLSAYSDQTRAESRNSDSQGCMMEKGQPASKGFACSRKLTWM